MAEDALPAGDRPTRREVLRTVGLTALGAAALGAAGACDIRLEDDAPPLPLLQRKSIPDEAVLIDSLRRTTLLRQLGGRVTPASDAVTAIARIHQTQAAVLRSRLTSGGVPNHVIDAATPTSFLPPSEPTSNPSAKPTAAVSAPPPAGAPDLVSAETTTLSAVLPRLAEVTQANRTVLASLVALCGAAVEWLGGAVTWPTADPLPTAAASRLLEDTRAAQYAFEVVAAQTTGARRAAALVTHTELGAREGELAAMLGGSVPPAPLGYALPFPVTTPDAAGRLATQVLGSVVAGGLAPAATITAGSGSAASALTTLIRLEVAAQRMGLGWGVPLTPFPGMAYP